LLRQSNPPLSGWSPALVHDLPVKDWATYALAMTTLAGGLVICWLLALRVIDAALSPGRGDARALSAS
jgi:hypothetical protein